MAVRLLAARIKEGRINRRMTQSDLAERIGVTQPTVARLERGDPTVGLGIAFEAAAVVGVTLFSSDPHDIAAQQARVDDRLAVLPQKARPLPSVDTDF